MARENGTNQAPTGKLYKGKGIKLVAEAESVESLVQLGQFIKGKALLDFKRKYGNILDLLHVPVHNDALVELGQYWDASLRCFTFSDFQAAPTIEEYGEILRMPVRKNTAVYLYPGHLPSPKAIAKILGVRMEEVRIVCPGQTEGISRSYVENHLKNLAREEAWDIFGRVFAMAIYGVIIFPSSVGIIDLGAISVFQMVEHHQVNPIPAILAETYLTLTQCHVKGQGKIKCCLPLLNIWILSHLYGKKFPFRERHDACSNPLASFKNREGNIQLS